MSESDRSVSIKASFRRNCRDETGTRQTKRVRRVATRAHGILSGKNIGILKSTGGPFTMNEKLSQVYDEIRKSHMSAWIGPGDPERVGLDLFEFVEKHVPLRPDMRILDLGCGLGRSTARFAEYLQLGSVVGIDVVDSMVTFCRQVIGSRFPNARFSTCAATDSYLKAPQSTNPKNLPSVEDILCAEGPFDLVLAFSVFTHLLPEEMDAYFSIFDRVVVPEGRLVLTFLFLDEWTRPAIRDGKLSAMVLEDTPKYASEPGQVCYASPSNPRAVVAIDLDAVLHMVSVHGFQPDRIVFGHWRGLHSETGQDALIMQRSLQRQLPTDFDAGRYLELYPDVAAARIDPALHFVAWGRREGRRYK
jgi:SAM-dependent methyltransferase